MLSQFLFNLSLIINKDMEQKRTYLTEEGLKKLNQELDYLKTTRRREVAQALQEAKEQGDLSENAEYSDAKEEQAKLEQRIAELEAMLKNAEVAHKENNGAVSVGSTVQLQMNGTNVSYTIVGANEANPTKGLISNESPLGTNLMGKKPGETVAVNTPSGSQNVKILDVK